MKKGLKGFLSVIIFLSVLGFSIDAPKSPPADYQRKHDISVEPAKQRVIPRAGSREVLIDEGFEGTFPPSGWDVVEISGTQGGPAPIPWHQNSGAAYIHTGSFGSAYGWGYNLDGWLRILNLDLSGAGSLTLSFWWKSSYEWHVNPYDNGDLLIEVSTDAGTTWDTLWTFGDSAMVVNSGVAWPWEDWIWYESSLNLDDYAGQSNVYIGFHVVADDNADIVLDDVLVVCNEPTITKFERAYGGTSNESAYYAEQTPDAGYIVAGRTQSFGAGDWDYYLVKTDDKGDTLWTRTYGGLDMDCCYGACPTSDGGYILFGDRGPPSSTSDIYLVKTYANGNTEWEDTYDIGQYDHAFAGDQTSDGGYIITGQGGPSGAQDLFLLKTDANGDSVWAETYDLGGSNDFGYSVQQTSDNGYIVGGHDPSSGYLMKTDANGDLEWTNTYGFIIYSVIQLPDNSYAFAGDNYVRAFMGKADADGNILWTRDYDVLGWGMTYAYSIQQTLDNGYIIAGRARSYGMINYLDALLIKTDANGDTLWTRTYGGPKWDPHDDFAWSVRQTSDRGYIIAGYTETYGAGGQDFYLIKTDSLGNLPDIKTDPPQITFDYTSKVGDKGLHCRSEIKVSGLIIEPELAEKITQTSNKEMIPVIIVMSEQLDQEFLYRHACELDKSDRRQWVISELKTLAQRTQQGLLSYLRTEKGTGKADRIHSLWIANAISAEVTKDIIHKLSSMPEIYQIFYDDDCFHILGKPSEASERALSKDIVWGVQKIRADQVWAAGYTGDGIIIGHIDTGVNYNHTDLIDHMWDGGEAYPHHGIDICNFDNDPIDDNGHGTHTAGTIAGDGTSGTQTGVAPDARIMALKALDADGNADCHRIGWSIQFALDHGADFVSISGGFSNPNDALKNYFRGVCDNAFAADLPLAVAAGNGDNAGGHYPVPHDINTPADVPAPWYGSAGHTAAMAVGMTNSSDVIDSWSSYGPTEWNTATYTDYPYPPGLMKPDVSAPGVNIVSLKHDNNTGYTGGWDGTSMACPHLAGTIALMLEKNPLLTCIEIDSIIENFGVVDLGTPGRDNYYGAGRIDAYNAVAAVPTTTAKKGDFYIHNDIPVGVSLKVSDITWSASWIKAVSPAKPETWKGDSTGIEVYVDSTGLAPGMYWDTLWIYSNDPDENPYPEPVCLITTIIGIEETEKTTQVPVASGLCHICPNPFSKSTVISYSSLVINDQLPVTNDLQYPVLRIYDVSGRIVKVFNLTSDLLLPASVISWDAKDDKGRKVPAGVYFVRLFVANPVGETRGFKQTHKVVLLH